MFAAAVLAASPSPAAASSGTSTAALVVQAAATVVALFAAGAAWRSAYQSRRSVELARTAATIGRLERLHRELHTLKDVPMRFDPPDQQTERFLIVQSRVRALRAAVPGPLDQVDYVKRTGPFVMHEAGGIGGNIDKAIAEVEDALERLSTESDRR